MKHAAASGKVIGFENDHIDLFYPRSYEDTCEGFVAKDVKKHKSRKKIYYPNVLLKDFSLGSGFQI